MVATQDYIHMASLPPRRDTEQPASGKQLQPVCAERRALRPVRDGRLNAGVADAPCFEPSLRFTVVLCSPLHVLAGQHH